MEAQTSATLSCLKLNANFPYEQATRSSATQSVWQRLERAEANVDLEMVDMLLEMQEDKDLFIRKTISKVLLQSTGGTNIFSDDIFRNQKVKVGNCLRWSRNLAAPAPFSAAPISSKTVTFSARLSDRTPELPKLVLGEVDNKRMTEKETEKSEQDVHLEEVENLHANLRKNLQCEKTEFEDLTGLTDEMVDAEVGKGKDRSVRRRFLKWLDELIHNHYRKKIAKSYRREEEEGYQFYQSNFSNIYPMTRAERERQKCELWYARENQREAIKRSLDTYWEKKSREKEALRIKEEERFERWVAEHDDYTEESSTDKGKNRMSIWEKRYLRVKQLIFE